MIYVTHQARPRHVRAVALSLREADRREILALHPDPYEVLLKSVDMGESFVVWLDGVPVGVGGFARDGSVTRPWLVGTSAMTRNWVGFAAASRPLFELMGRKYESLENWVSTQNSLHRRWLRWLGFQFRETTTVNGTEFQRFVYV